MKLPDDFDIDSLPVIGEGAAQTPQAQTTTPAPPVGQAPATAPAPQAQPQADDFDLDSLPEIRRFRMSDGEDIDVDERAIARLRQGQIPNPFAPIGTDREAERANVSRRVWKEAGLPEKYGRSQKDRDDVARRILDAWDTETKAASDARAARKDEEMASLEATRPAFEAQRQQMLGTQMQMEEYEARRAEDAAREDLGPFERLYLEDVASKGADEGVLEFIGRRLPVIGAYIKLNDNRMNYLTRKLARGEYSNPMEMARAAMSAGIPEETVRQISEQVEDGPLETRTERARKLWMDELSSAYAMKQDFRRRADTTLRDAADPSASTQIVQGAFGLPRTVTEMTGPGVALTGFANLMNRAAELEERGDSEGTAVTKAAVGYGAELLIWNRLGKVAEALPGAGNVVKRAGQALAKNRVTGNAIAQNAGQILEMNAKSGLTELVDDVIGMNRAGGEENKEFGEWFREFISVPGNAKKMLEMLPAHLVMKGVGKGKQMLTSEGRKAARSAKEQRRFIEDFIGKDEARGLSDLDVQNIYKIVSSPNLTEKSVSDTLSFIEGKAGTENRQGALRELRKKLREGREQAESRDAAMEGAEKAYAEQDASIRENAMRQEAARRGITDEKEVEKFGKLYEEYAAEKTVLPFDEWLEERKAAPRAENEAAREAKRKAKAEEAADAARAEQERLQAEAEQEAAIKERAEQEAKPNAAVEEMKAAEAEARKQETNPHQARLDAWPEYAAFLAKNHMKNTAKNWNKFVMRNNLDPNMKVETPDQAKKRGAKEFERGLAPDEELAAFDEYSKYVQGEEYQSGRSNLSFDEWLAQRREGAKNEPVSAPREEGTTTPPNGAEPPQGAETGENRDTPRPLPPPDTAQAVKEPPPEPKKPFGTGDSSHGQGKYSRKNYDGDAANTGATGAATWHWQNGERMYSLPVDLSQTRPGGPVVLDKTDSAYERIKELLNGRQLVMTKSGKIQFKGEFKGAVPKELRELLGRELKIGKNPDAPSKDDLYGVNKGQFGEETRTTWEEVEKAVAADRENYHNWQKRQQRADRRASEEKKLEKKVRSGKAAQNELDILRHRNMMEDYLDQGGKETDADYKAMERDLEVLQESGTYDYEGLSKAKDAADKFRDAEWENAIGDIESGEGDFSPSDQYVKPFTRENLQGAKKGDIIHFDHDEVKYELDRYDPETGVMDVYRSDENGVKRRFKVSRNGVEEIRHDGKGQKGVVQDNAGDAGGGGRPAPGAAGGEARGAEGAGGASDEFDILKALDNPNYITEWNRRHGVKESTDAEIRAGLRKQIVDAAQSTYDKYRNSVLKNSDAVGDSEFLRVVRDAENVEDFVKGVKGLIEKHRAVRDDWAGRSYKTSRKRVEVADRSDAFTMAEGETNRLSTDYINERRRRNRVEGEEWEMARLRESLEKVLGKQTLEDLETKYLPEYPAGMSLESPTPAENANIAELTAKAKSLAKEYAALSPEDKVGARGKELERRVEEAWDAVEAAKNASAGAQNETAATMPGARADAAQGGESGDSANPAPEGAPQGVTPELKERAQAAIKVLKGDTAKPVAELKRMLSDAESRSGPAAERKAQALRDFIAYKEAAEANPKPPEKVGGSYAGRAQAQEQALSRRLQDQKFKDWAKKHGVTPTKDHLEMYDREQAKGAFAVAKRWIRGIKAKFESRPPTDADLGANDRAMAADDFVPFSEADIERTKKEYGTTDDIGRAGFIAPDGSLIDMNRSFKPFPTSMDLATGRRTAPIEHGEVGSWRDQEGFLDKEGSRWANSEYEAMAGGMVRIRPEIGMIEVGKKLTDAQKDAIREFCDKASRAGHLDGVDVVCSTKDGYSGILHVKDFSGSRVLGAIDEYFSTGKINGAQTTGNVRYLRNVRGDIIGKWDKATGEVTFYPGANAETVAHEIGWHATYDHAEKLAAQGDRRLLDKLNAYARGAQQATWTKTLTRYGMASDPRMIIDEVGAARFTAEQAMKIKNEVDRRAALKWYGKAWEACRDAYKSMLTKMGFNKTSVDALNGMSPERAVEFMATEMARGKTLAKVEAKKVPGVNDALTAKEKYVRAAKDSMHVLKWVDEVTGGRFHLHRDQKLSHGMKQKAFDRAMQFWNEMATECKAAGIKLTELDEYIRAKGAADTNRRIKALNGNENGAGISDVDAARTVLQYERGAKGAAMERISQKLWDLQHEGLMERVNAGLVDAKFAADLEANEPFHVPRHNRFDANGEFTGYETNAQLAANEWHKAEGRTTDSANAVGWIMQEYCDAFSRGAENRVRQRLAQALLASNGVLGNATVVTPANEARLAEKTKANKNGNAQVVIVKQGGKKVALELNGVRGEAVARALTGRDMKEMPSWVKKTLRIWASTATEWSPTFALRNLTADLADVMLLNIGDHGIVKGLKRDAGHIKAMATLARDIRQYVKTGKTNNAILNEAIGAGILIGGMGREGFTDPNEAHAFFQDRMQLYGEEGLKRAARRGIMGAKNVAKSLFGWVETINKTTELMNRLADYKKSRDMGMSARDAAAHARDITVDFNEKGEWTGVSNALYMFSNSTMGAAFRQVKALTGEHWKGLVGTTLAIGFAEGLAEAMNGDEDDADKAGTGTGEDVNEYTRANSLYLRFGNTTVRTPFHAGPLSIIKYTGNCAARYMAGMLNDKNKSAIKGSEAAANIGKEASGLITHFLGLGDAGPNVMQTITPSVLQWLVQLGQNRDYADRPIAKPKFDEAMPSSENGRRSTAEGYKDIARLLNEWSGGSAGRKGSVDYAPEQYKVISEAVGKNVLRDVTSTAQTIGYVIDIFRGNADIDTRNIPVVRDFVRVNHSGNTQRYYEAATGYREDRYELQKMVAQWTPEERKAYVEKHPWARNPEVNKAIQKIGELQKLEDGFVKNGRGWVKRKEQPTEEQKAKWKAARLRYQARFLEYAEKHGGEH